MGTNIQWVSLLDTTQGPAGPRFTHRFFRRYPYSPTSCVGLGGVEGAPRVNYYGKTPVLVLVVDRNKYKVLLGQGRELFL